MLPTLINKQQNNKLIANINRLSNFTLMSNSVLVVLLIIQLIISGYGSHCLSLEGQKSNENNENENYNNKHHQALAKEGGFEKITSSKPSGISLVKRDIYSDDDHELPAEFYYQTMPASNDAALTKLQQHRQRNNMNRYRDYNTIVYPDGDQGNYDLEKRPEWATTRSTLDEDLNVSEPLKFSLLQLLKQQNYPIASTSDRDLMPASEGGQRWKRRGGSSCNFNSGLTSKCDNMDYIQAWNHHNWFHKKTLPG